MIQYPKTIWRSALVVLLCVLSSLSVACGDDTSVGGQTDAYSSSGSSSGSDVTSSSGVDTTIGLCAPSYLCDSPIDPAISCGPGTFASGDFCFPMGDSPIDPAIDSPIDPAIEGDCDCNNAPSQIVLCAPGTQLGADDQCVADYSVIGCPEGTQPSPQGMRCVPVCDVGTVLNADETACVPDCGAGTSLDPETNQCVINAEAVCEEGTYVSQRDTCVDLEGLLADGAEARYESTDSPDAQDDPFLFTFVLDACDGCPTEGAILSADRVSAYAPTAITLPTLGNTALLTGVISLLGDVSGDDLPDQDWDVFAFESEAGQRLRLTANSAGLPAPHVELFRVEAVGPGDDLSASTFLPDQSAFTQRQRFVRVTPERQFIDPTREYFLGEAGLYFIRITDGFSLPPTIDASSGTPTYLDAGLQTGGDLFNYFIAIENLGRVDAAELLEENLIELDAINVSEFLLSGDADEYGRVSQEVFLLRFASMTAGAMTVEAQAYDDDAFSGSGLISIYDVALTQTLDVIELREDTMETFDVPAEGVIINHDFSRSVHTPQRGYELLFELAVP